MFTLDFGLKKASKQSQSCPDLVTVDTPQLEPYIITVHTHTPVIPTTIVTFIHNVMVAEEITGIY